jgi:hypothetical protein
MDPPDFSTFDTIAEENSEDEVAESETGAMQEVSEPQSLPHSKKTVKRAKTSETEAARKELQLHELVALFSCFVFPFIGAWLLHAIREQLSRPSEGLVSNYNLTVFLLASEIRPVSHLVKMIQARTLYLQRVVSPNGVEDDQKFDPSKMNDLLKRVEELEAHVADSVEDSSKNANMATDAAAAKTTAQAVTETRRSLQPELDALNRAVRRYEKRTTISSLQTEARLHDLESRLKDVVVLAAAAQRNAEKQPQNFMLILLNWMCAVVVLPTQYAWFLLQLPLRAVQKAMDFVQRTLRLKQGTAPKQPRPGNQSKVRDRRSKLALQ